MPEMLGFWLLTSLQLKSRILTFVPENHEKSTVKYLTEKTILLNFMKWSTFPFPSVYEETHFPL